MAWLGCLLAAFSSPHVVAVKPWLRGNASQISCHDNECASGKAMVRLRSVASVLRTDPNIIRLEVILPIVSSLDNFAVGAAIGISDHPLPLSTNLIVSLANTAGMMLSDSFGQWVGSKLGNMISYLAASLFILLGLLELWESCTEQNSMLQRVTTVAMENPWVLAIPLTLNNLAGGLAGGLAGASVWIIGINTFLASFLLMLVGHYLGHKLGSKLEQVNPQLLSAIAFLCLGVEELICQT